MNLKDMTDEQYGLLFAVRRSIRYHDRRAAFFERLHQITGGLTVLLAGSVLFDLARPGNTPAWLTALALTAALLAVWDIVVGYAGRAGLHRDLKNRFVALEIAVVEGDATAENWTRHQIKRLTIERDEPPVYRALDTLCHNEMLIAEGYDRNGAGKVHFAPVTAWQRATRHFLHWGDIAAG